MWHGGLPSEKLSTSLQVDCNLAHPGQLFKSNFQFLTASTWKPIMSWLSYRINVIMMMKIVTMMMMMMMMVTHWSPQVQYSRLNEPWKDWKGGSWRPRCCSMQTVDLCPYIMHCHTWYLSFPCIFQACFICNAVSTKMRIIWFISFNFQFYLPRTYPTDIYTLTLTLLLFGKTTNYYTDWNCYSGFTQLGQSRPTAGKA